MRVTVRLFARLRDLAGETDCVFEIPSGASVADVWHALARRHPSLEPFARAVTSAVNAEFAHMTDTVRDGDEVAFLPPVSGGAGTETSDRP